MKPTRRIRLGFDPVSSRSDFDIAGYPDLAARKRLNQHDSHTVFCTAQCSCDAAEELYFDDRVVEAVKWSQVFLQDADDLFFGDWRNHCLTDNGVIDAVWWDRVQSWDFILPRSMLWAAANANWELFDKFATYLRDDVKLCVDQKPYERAWWLFFCGKVRKRPSQDLEGFRQTVDASVRKAEKALLVWVDALYGSNAQQLQAAVDEYCSIHLKYEAKAEERVYRRLGIRPSILLHLGLRFGKKSQVPAAMEPYLFEIPGGGTIGAGINSPEST